MITNPANGNYESTPIVVLPDGVNRFVLFMFADRGDGVYATPPSGVTINSVAMTLYTGVGVYDEASQIWGLSIPNTWAAGNYPVTRTGSAVFNNWYWAVFAGVSRDPVVDADSIRINVATNDFSTLTVDCVDGGWVHDIVWASSAKVAGAGQSVIYNITGRAGISYKSSLTQGTSTMRWDWTDSRSAHSAISLRPHKSGSGIIMF